MDRPWTTRRGGVCGGRLDVSSVPEVIEKTVAICEICQWGRGHPSTRGGIYNVCCAEEFNVNAGAELCGTPVVFVHIHDNTRNGEIGGEFGEKSAALDAPIDKKSMGPWGPGMFGQK